VTGAIALAVVLGAGTVPIPESVQRFPDPAYWPGSGVQQVGNMLEAIADQAGALMRTSGPGPQQLLARWKTGRLNAAERVSVLLAGGTFHNPVLLPIYPEAMRSTVLRERRAAAVGLAWLIGERPPDPTAIQDTPQVWSEMAAAADAVTRTAQRYSLVQMWVRSLLVAKGEPRPGGLVLRRTAQQCLAAIREIAEPDDVNDLIALWPLLDRQEQLSLLKTLEIITVQRFSEVAVNPRAPTGPWLDDIAIARVDDWVRGACRTMNGASFALRAIRSTCRSDEARSEEPTVLLCPLAIDFPSMWPVPAELLTAFGAPAVNLDRRRLDDPANEDRVGQVRRAFEISMSEVRAKPVKPRRRRGG
jgi:hypothetical protein